MNSTERRAKPRGDPNGSTPGYGMYGDERTMVVRIPCAALAEVRAICEKYRVNPRSTASQASEPVPEA